MTPTEAVDMLHNNLIECQEEDPDTCPACAELRKAVQVLDDFILKHEQKE